MLLGETQASLRPADAADTALLYDVALDRDVEWQRVCRGGVPPRPAFPGVLAAEGIGHFFVELAGSTLAYFCAYRPDLGAKSCWVEFLVLQDVDRQSARWLSIESELLTFLQDRWSFRRLLCSYPEFAGPQFRAVEVLGRLQDDVLSAGEYWDLIVAEVNLPADSPLSEGGPDQ